MSYLTVEEYEILYASDYSDLSSIGDIDSAINYAEAEADSYIGVMYALPLNSVPLVLKNKVADIARYQMDQLCAREDVRQRYEDAMSWFRGVSQGKISLGIDASGDVAESSAVSANFTTHDQIFSDSSLGGYF